MPPKKNQKTIDDAQLHRMLARYQDVLARRAAIESPTVGDEQLDRARELVVGARAKLAAGDYADARHMTGMVQGILYCRRIYDWHYLATDDDRA